MEDERVDSCSFFVDRFPLVKANLESKPNISMHPFEANTSPPFQHHDMQ